MKSGKIRSIILLVIISLSGFQLHGQLKMGGSQSEINFREGPGLDSRIINTISSSNLLVILPGEAVNRFVQVFDIETSSFGFVYEQLIRITDTIYFQKQQYFERSDTSGTGDVVIELINRTDRQLFVWINKKTYSLDPHEKKDLVFNDEDITYFSSSPGMYPVFGREVLKRGYTYLWNFSL